MTASQTTDYIAEGLAAAREIYGEGIRIWALDPSPNGRGRMELTGASVAKMKAMNARGDGIYFTPPDGPLRAVFVDDCPDAVGSWAVRTRAEGQAEKGAHQAHWRLAHDVSDEDAHLIQLALIDEHRGDPKSSGARQLRRLPGFTNPKYPGRPFVRTVLYAPWTELQFDLVDVDESTASPAPRAVRSTAEPVSARSADGEIRKRWADYYDGKDRSAADMRYAVYLFGRGLDAATVSNMLRAESAKAQERGDDYLAMTVSKAQAWQAAHASPGRPPGRAG